uniref:Growth hormone receptor a n=1 Tax=Cyprinus carpio TaxID=7962 RepID=A0A8C1TK13_CYPCA
SFVSFSYAIIFLIRGTQNEHYGKFSCNPSRGPHFTGCRSREQETFRCWWSAGTFQNLTEPGALRVFYQTKNALSEWQECPDYTRTVENECYFNKTYTQIWTSYCVQLRSVPQNITYDEACFTVENIAGPGDWHTAVNLWFVY